MDTLLPQELTITRENNGNLLSWTFDPNAIEYKLYYSDYPVNDWDYPNLGVYTNTSFFDDFEHPLGHGFYRVKSTNVNVFPPSK
jgi:hypothetical protein